MGLGGASRGGVPFGLGQIRTRILGDGERGFALGGQDQSHGGFDFPSGQPLSLGRHEQGHLQDGGQTTELEGGDRAEFGGLHEGVEVFVQTPDESQTPLHPGFAPAQEPGDGRRPQSVVLLQVLDKSRLLPQGDGAAAGIEREHQRLGLLAIGWQNAYGNLSRALGLENGQALESVDEFQSVVDACHGQGLQDLRGEAAREFSGHVALEALQGCAEFVEVQCRQFHIVTARFCALDLLRCFPPK